MKQDKFVKMIRRPGEGEVYYVLSQSQTVHKQLTMPLISKCEELRSGYWPTGIQMKTQYSKKAVLAIKNSMYRVVRSTGKDVCPCDANPFKLACKVCKSFAHDGICKHVLAITHIIMHKDSALRDVKCNLRLLSKPLSHDKAKHRLRAPTCALVRQPKDKGAADSSDDEVDTAMAIMEGKEW